MGATDPDISVAKKKLFAKIHSREEGDRKQIEEGVEGQREHFDNQFVFQTSLPLLLLSNDC